jgi:hypothetical protein
MTVDLIDKLTELANRIKRQRDQVKTEEAVKTAFILPFIQALGYDVFNPAEVIPELTADHGVKKGEKVDYAIKLDEKIMILIECKQVDAPLEAKHAGQLFRYFSVTEAKFGVLTDGVRYLFYTDLEAPNKMDERPFFEFNLLDFNESAIDELKKFTKTAFDVDIIVSTASNLKYLRALLNEIKAEFLSPSEDLVRLLSSRAIPGFRWIAQIKEQYTDLTRRALDTFLKETINLRLKSAMATEGDTSLTPTPSAQLQASNISSEVSEPDIITSEEEYAAHRIIQAICSEIVSADDIVIRDNKSYCAILYENNNRRPIVRLYFNRKQSLQVVIFREDSQGKVNEEKINISRVTDIFKLRVEILATIKMYLPKPA